MKNNPNATNAAIEKMDNTMNKAMKSISSVYFETYEINEKENKFFVNSSDWKHYSFSEKKDILEFAASMSASEREKIDNAQNSNTKKYYSKTSELTRTKIYSIQDKKLLGEYVYNKSSYENVTLKEYIKESMKAYKFYNP